MDHAQEFSQGSFTEDHKITEIVQKEKGRLLNFIRRRIPEVEDAEDILQDVFYELVQSYRMLRPVEQLASWMFTVARNKITDSYRKKKAGSLEDILLSNTGEDEPLLLADILKGDSVSSEDQMMNEWIMEAVEDALEELPEEQRDAFILHELEDRSMKEISGIMEVPVKTVISRKRYAVMYLREKLKDRYTEFMND